MEYQGLLTTSMAQPSTMPLAQSFGIVDNAAGLVGLDALALYHPFDSGLAVDHTPADILKDVSDSDVVSR